MGPKFFELKEKKNGTKIPLHWHGAGHLPHHTTKTHFIHSCTSSICFTFHSTHFIILYIFNKWVKWDDINKLLYNPCMRNNILPPSMSYVLRILGLTWYNISYTTSIKIIQYIKLDLKFIVRFTFRYIKMRAERF